MALTTRKTALALAIAATATAVAAGGLVWAGVYDVGADAPHTRPVYALLETVRKRSIAVRADELQAPPDLSSPVRLRQGAGNYEAMCSGCHLAPGMRSTELSRGLYPAPPDLSKTPVDPRHAFWTIKHGIKASGMPAWGASMGDDYIWNMAALLQALPGMDADQYRALVAESGGHSHGGGETADRDHPHGDDGDHGAAAELEGTGHPSQAAASGSETDEPGSERRPAHVHADGKPHAHPPTPTAPPTPAKTVAPKPAAVIDAPANEHEAHEHAH
ncbi:c-type cytochrome [Lysobacter sp. cf310]|uniref:c-type cytochrome n=1 Tax=Lysobacter sp. cf310 TaxID=1761790 RepID=UPI0008EA9552|nr:cytochrome c [Lysobacter sp. cf310]SFK92640.1 Cytochrome C oxidase, cbb3-type, subunit III [Lysobacter sp. cf310]